MHRGNASKDLEIKLYSLSRSLDTKFFIFGCVFAWGLILVFLVFQSWLGDFSKVESTRRLGSPSWIGNLGTNPSSFLLALRVYIYACVCGHFQYRATSNSLLLLRCLQNKKMSKDISHKDHDHDHTEAAAACSTTGPQAIALQIASSVTATASATAHQNNNNNVDQSPSSSTTSPLTEIPTLVYRPDTNCNYHCNCSEKQESRFIKRKKKIEKIKAEEQKARKYAIEVLAKLVPSHIKFTVL